MNEAGMTRCYKSIEVDQNDTLRSIAEQYAPKYGMSVPEYMQELTDLNQLSDDRVESGSYFLIVCPYTVFYLLSSASLQFTFVLRCIVFHLASVLSL